MKSIKDLYKNDRPREKIFRLGPGVLSNEELIAVIIGSGHRGGHCMSLAAKVNNRLGLCTSRENMHETVLGLKVLGPANRARLSAALELFHRLGHPAKPIHCAEEALPYCHAIRRLKQEHFVCLTLDGAHHLLQSHTITVGLLNQSPIHPREVFAAAISDRAAAVILVHNHPSGNNRPSAEDRRTTEVLAQAGQLLGIPVLDHIIVTSRDHFSFRENHLL